MAASQQQQQQQLTCIHTHTRPYRCWLKATIMPQVANAARVSGIMNASLVPHMYTPISLANVAPAGWLRDELAAEADGLVGHLQLFWPDVENSTWIGGTHDPGLHERTPYWLNGFVPLAFLLRNETLQGYVWKVRWRVVGVCCMLYAVC